MIIPMSSVSARCLLCVIIVTIVTIVNIVNLVNLVNSVSPAGFDEYPLPDPTRTFILLPEPDPSYF